MWAQRPSKHLWLFTYMIRALVNFAEIKMLLHDTSVKISLRSVTSVILYIYIYIYMHVCASLWAHLSVCIPWITTSSIYRYNKFVIITGEFYTKFIINHFKQAILLNYISDLSIILSSNIFRLVCLFGLVLWHINHCRLFNAKSMFIQINSSISNKYKYSFLFIFR